MSLQSVSSRLQRDPDGLKGGLLELELCSTLSLEQGQEVLKVGGHLLQRYCKFTNIRSGEGSSNRTC